MATIIEDVEQEGMGTEFKVKGRKPETLPGSVLSFDLKPITGLRLAESYSRFPAQLLQKPQSPSRKGASIVSELISAKYLQKNSSELRSPSLQRQKSSCRSSFRIAPVMGDLIFSPVKDQTAALQVMRPLKEFCLADLASPELPGCYIAI